MVRDAATRTPTKTGPTRRDSAPLAHRYTPQDGPERARTECRGRNGLRRAAGEREGPEQGGSESLPKAELTDLVVGVDRWTHFPARLTYAAGSEPTTAGLRRHLHAAILARVTNVGPVRMADLAELSYEKIAWATTWYVREDTLTDAVASVVDFHHVLPWAPFGEAAPSPPRTASASPSTSRRRTRGHYPAASATARG
ncbi:Tn3 family transposase [Rubrobacter marinus]|uniref:Tn3 family transposase n=1 Tax=Rubrobacter marinus TaxID=2653852 RepID=A0A6G8PXE0_9ACTN|nr:Tn3 family transposase [Rubrobacter marinus]